ncbi:MAG: CehA/McbA family metallohydrolase [Planctomycetota bacterium]
MQDLFTLFQKDGRGWFKGNTHTHTTCSDGVRAPEEAVDWYRRAGYDFLFLTEHEQKLATPEALPDFEKLSSQEMLVFPGLELYVDLDDPPCRTLHVAALGTAKTGVWRPDWNLRRTIDFILGEGAVPVLAHPYYNAVSHDEIADASGCVAVEVFNTTCDVACGNGHASSHWDYLLGRGLAIHGVAADDAHWCRQVPDYGNGWIMLKADRLSLPSVLDALKEGSFYASMGPELIDVSLAGDEVVVSTSPARRISFISHNGYSSVEHAADGRPLTSARRVLSSFRKFLRIECVDAEGRFAWTNAVMLG